MTLVSVNTKELKEVNCYAAVINLSSRKAILADMPNLILVIEDEKDLHELLSFHLKGAGFDAAFTTRGEEGLALAQKKNPVLILLDLMLPGMNGMEVCRRLKQNEKTRAIPVVMLTAKGEEIDKVGGFEVGAEDYVTKPFSPWELVLRIKNILKRSSDREAPPQQIQVGSLEADFSRPRITYKGKKIGLTAVELKLLQFLFANRGRVQSREQLLDRVWGYASTVNTRTVDAHVKRLREKLGEGGHLIETVRGLGYRFVEEI